MSEEDFPDPLERWEAELNGEIAPEEEVPNPFAADVAPGLSLIVNLRIYDVLMALLKESNPAAAREILELHSHGGLGGSAPDFNGFFATDEVNRDESPEDLV